VVTDTQRHTQTNPQTDRLQYTSPLSLVRSVTNSVNYEEHRKSIEAVANYAAPLIGREAYKEISGVARILCQGAQQCFWRRENTENNKCMSYHPG